ncbi:hypothetical protein SAMN04487895_101559 [Paenibacillus sophorae]|uniref:Nucleoside 2-deoxyribosyltransferase n=1 Tax=Paenibacillus sophorae TaxID=1333845 RepID=A0A1H8GLR0_9BACL|nr:hypothetical protein [Paenibacillus sophorae]QWU14263.1 hypothetical protein KP014_20360 [Paenibacillus sophorae]SEN44715.1 hypothetical protein SAMN04487895_101559 [Paenibacillus sophorae]
MQIYLSGGMYGTWQDKLPKIEGVTYFDPRSVEQTASYRFVLEDIEQVKKSDLVFCYMEKDNPSGFGATWECATAFENNIPIITVWEKSYIDPFFACCSLFLFNDFEKGLSKLKKFAPVLLKNT